MTVQRLVARGELPVVKLGDRSLFRPADIDALIERSRRSGGQS
jgi:excisionase family DNA binding protein